MELILYYQKTFFIRDVGESHVWINEKVCSNSNIYKVDDFTPPDPLIVLILYMRFYLCKAFISSISITCKSSELTYLPT